MKTKAMKIKTVANPKFSNVRGGITLRVIWVESAKSYIVDTNQFGLWIDPRDIA